VPVGLRSGDILILWIALVTKKPRLSPRAAEVRLESLFMSKLLTGGSEQLERDAPPPHCSALASRSPPRANLIWHLVVRRSSSARGQGMMKNPNNASQCKCHRGGPRNTTVRSEGVGFPTRPMRGRGGAAPTVASRVGKGSAGSHFPNRCYWSLAVCREARYRLMGGGVWGKWVPLPPGTGTPKLI